MQRRGARYLARAMYKHVLAATDFSELGDRALQRAVAIAQRFGATLGVLHVLAEQEVPTLYNREEIGEFLGVAEAAKQKARELLDERLAKLDPEKALSVHLEVRTGVPAEQVLDYADECDADLIVVGTSGKRGMRRWLLGSNAELVVRGSARDVIVVGRAMES